MKKDIDLTKMYKAAEVKLTYATLDIKKNAPSLCETGRLAFSLLTRQMAATK